MGRRYREALELWRAIGDEAEIANALYNASFTYAVPTDRSGRTRGRRRRRDRPRLPREARELYRELGDAGGEANVLWGDRQLPLLPEPPGPAAIDEFREALEIFRRIGDLTMEAWALHMLGTALLRQRQRRRGHGRTSSTPCATSTRRATRPGIALDLRRPVGASPWPRATSSGRPACAGAAREPRRPRPVPSWRRSSKTPSSSRSGRACARTWRTVDLERYGAEGAAMTLDEAVAYALEGSGLPEPTSPRRRSMAADGATSGVRWQAEDRG